MISFVDELFIETAICESLLDPGSLYPLICSQIICYKTSECTQQMNGLSIERF